jgi:hypothetical protein
MANTAHKKMISNLKLAFSNASVAQFKSVLQQDSFAEIKEFFHSKDWKTMVATHSKHLTPHQAFGFGAALSKSFGEETPFQDFVKNCTSFNTYLESLKHAQKSV